MSGVAGVALWVWVIGGEEMSAKFESPDLRITKAELEEYEQTVKEIQGKDIHNYLISTFEKTVKKDRRTVELIFGHLLSGYSSDPSNLGISGPTSEGKTWPTVEVAKHFPKDDVWFLGGLSPTALIHGHSELVDKNDKPLESRLTTLYNQMRNLKKAGEKKAADLAIVKEEIAELVKGSRYLVDMENKILIFLEAPQLETWEKIRPILSHDVYEISYKFTDTSAKKLKTEHVVIRGWPATVYLKAGRGREDMIWPQIQSRFTTISPRMSAEKYRAAIQFGAMRKGLPSVVFDRKVGMGEFKRVERIIRTIRRRLLDIKYKAREASNTPDPNIFWVPFYERIGAEFPASVGRHMRDSKRFITVMQMSAAANIFTRPILKIDGAEYIVVTRGDYEQAVRLFFEEAGEEIFSGIPGHILEFFKEIILPLGAQVPSGITVKEMVEKNKEIYHTGKSANTIRQHYLPYLENYGLITSAPDPNNKSQNLWVVLQEEITPKDTHIHALFESGGVFTSEMLKAQLNDLNTTPPHDPQICNNKGEPVTADQLWNEYYSFTDSSGGVRLSPKQAPTKEHPKENTHKIETGESGGELEKISSVKLTGEKGEPTAHDIEKAVCEYRKTTIPKAELAENLGVSLDRLKVVLEELEKKRAVIDRGSMVEVV